MSLQIGYEIYNKTTKEMIDSDENYLCGRNEANDAWGQDFRLGWTDSTAPIFDEELDGQVIGGYQRKFIPIGDYISHVNYQLDDLTKEALKIKNNFYNRIQRNQAEIIELRELQLKCNSENAYAFNRYEDRIQELKDYIEDDKELIKEDEMGCQILAVQKLLLKMKNDHDRGLTVVPYYSC